MLLFTMEKQKTEGQKLNEYLTFDRLHIAEQSPEQIDEAKRFCEGYKLFLNHAKTERECVTETIHILKKNGYQEFNEKTVYQPGDKIYFNNRNKALIITTIGSENLEKGLRINAAHIDSPRLDLKPNPLYESKEIALLKTHYYGGIKKYQWATIPLSMHGVIIKKNGEVISICIGEDSSDPVFCVTDLLPHLSAEQNKRTLAQGLKGEELNIVFGTLPFPDKEIKNRVKLFVLQLLHEKYGITEEDFIRAEIEMVPAYQATDVGLDRSLIGSYGQDDRVCAYTALMAEIEVKNPVYTTLCILADKEEIGSCGNTGLESMFFLHFIQYLSQLYQADEKTVLRHSKCLSADVNAAFDPTFPQVMEANNACYLNKGCVITKYTGARGKSGTSDASAEFMSYITNLLDEAHVHWQTGELGSVDMGGGGTVAKYIAFHNIDVVDIGVPVLSMHSPFELSAKLDIYHTYAAFKAFLEDKNQK